MALGALALSKEKAIVSKLSAIEEMAGVDILCSDKTGTLTKNQLTLGDPILFSAKNAEDCILGAALASKIEDRDAIGNQSLSLVFQARTAPFATCSAVVIRQGAFVLDSSSRAKEGEPWLIMLSQLNATAVCSASIWRAS
jgi:magnesium-transporting ATPase (P-type)